MSDLVAFIEARLAEDEVVALATTGDVWTTSPSKYIPGRYVHHDKANGRSVRPATTTPATDAEHIARHDPARVLAGVAAKRRVLALHWSLCEWCGHACEECGRDFPCQTVRLLASEWAGADGWDEGWGL